MVAVHKLNVPEILSDDGDSVTVLVVESPEKDLRYGLGTLNLSTATTCSV